jgi:cytochrome c oxidase subunit III
MLLFVNLEQAFISLISTNIFAFIFTSLQGFEYNIADFRFTDGMYGSTFYMATGFHVFHVYTGTLFLFVV